jgi:hypothetical protein
VLAYHVSANPTAELIISDKKHAAYADVQCYFRALIATMWIAAIKN